MKKLLPGILALLLAFGGLTACTPTDPESTPSGSTPPASTSDSTPGQTAHPHETDLKDVKDYLLEQLAKKDLSTYKDFTVPSSFNFIGDTAIYDIAWTSNVAAVTIEAGTTEDTVKIGEVSEDTPFVLTATVTDPDGCHTTTFTVDGVALPQPTIVPNAISAKPVENTAYKLYMYQVTKEQDLYFTGKMSGFYFATTNASNGETYEQGVDLYVEYITGGDSFNIYFKDASDVKQYIGVEEGWNSKNNYWTFNVVFGTTAPSSFVWSDENRTIITTVPCRSDADNKDQSAAQTTTKTVYLGTSGTYYTFSAMNLSKIKDADACVGKLVEMVDKSTIVTPDTTKVAEVKASLNVGTKYTLDKEVTLKTSDSNYDDVTITWSVAENTAATVNGDKLNLVIPAEKTTVVLTATITCGTASDTKEFTLELGPKTVAPDKTDSAAIVAAAYNLASGETLPGGNYTLTGEITEVNSAWSDQYSNITVTITVGDKTFECYRLASGDADASTLKVGDTITVTGAIKNYNGKVEFDQGCVLDAVVEGTGGTETPDPTPSADEEIVNAAYALEKGAALEGTQTLTGVVVSVDEKYSTQYKNITLTIVIGNLTDKPIKCYRLKGDDAETVGVADVITVTGTIKNYNGTIEFDTGCTFVTVTAHTCTAWSDATCQVPALCTVCGDAKDSVLAGHNYVEGSCSVCGASESSESLATAEATLSFAAKDQRTFFDTNKQVWEQNGITLTNEKASSTSDVADYANPARFYKSSSIEVTAPGQITKIEFVANSASYATALQSSIGTVDGATVTVNGSTVIVTFSTPVDSFVIASLSGGQVRMDSVTVTYVTE